MARDIKYTPKDTNWAVDNVEAAINSLQLSKTADNYSTEERVVGSWIDGKPLYQRTLELTTSKGTITTLDSDINVRQMFGYITNTVDSKRHQVITSYFGGTNGFSVGIETNNTIIFILIIQVILV